MQKPFPFSGFSGSYAAEDVHFLLRPIEITMTPVTVKEQLIQSGASHYSDMLSYESAPTARHSHLFNQALKQGAHRLAQEVLRLAQTLAAQQTDTALVLISLVRAGVPLGVMLQQTLRDMGKNSYHYGISIIRDRGIDTTALDWIESKHGTEGIVFVDGWTGKGAISHELSKALNGRKGYPEQPKLVVLADPCGYAWLSASHDDWLIPFGIMGAPVSGLISRSVWSAEDLHGCMLCEHLQEHDCSQHLVDTVAAYRHKLMTAATPTPLLTTGYSTARQQRSKGLITNLVNTYHIDSINRIKPGIAEATRAVLRRVPEHVLVRNCNDLDVALLIYLAKEIGIPIKEVGEKTGPYHAITIIKKVSV